jgi:hypothetical protein
MQGHLGFFELRFESRKVLSRKELPFWKVFLRREFHVRREFHENVMEVIFILINNIKN